MPTYEIQAPDGRTYAIDGPEGARDEDVQAEVLRQFPEAANAPSGPLGRAALKAPLSVLEPQAEGPPIPLVDSMSPPPKSADSASSRPLDPYGQMDIGFASKDANEANSRPPGSDQYVQEVNRGIADGSIKSPDELKLVASRYGYSFDDDESLGKTFDALASGARFGGANPAEYRPDISDARDLASGGGLAESGKAALRGIPGALGVDDELLALYDAAVGGGTFSENLARNRSIRDFDQDNHFWSRLSGELAGGLALPTRVNETARSAARLALREGLGREVAERAARYAAMREMGLEGAGYGAAHGFGSADGDVVDRLAGSVEGGAIGGPAGLAMGAVGSAAGARLTTRASRPPSPGREAARETYEAAERQNVDLLPADLGGPIVGNMTARTAQTPYGVPRIREAAQRGVDSFKAARDRLAGEMPEAREFGEAISGNESRAFQRSVAAIEGERDAVMNVAGTPSDLTGAGQAAQRGARSFVEETARRADHLYRRIPIENNTPAQLENTRRLLQEHTAAMASNPQMGDLFANRRMQAFRDALTVPEGARPERPGEIPGGLSWGDLTEFRTRVGDMLDDPRLAERIPMRQLRALYGALSTDMEATARANGPGAFRAWKRANNYYDGRQKRIKNALSLILGQRHDATANEAFSAIERLAKDAHGGDFARLGQVLRSLPDEDAAIVRSTMIARTGGDEVEFLPDKFAKVWDRVSDRAKSYLLPQAGAREAMDGAAERAAQLEASPLIGKSGEDVVASLTRMANNRGDARKLKTALHRMSPEEARDLRALVIGKLGDSTPGKQDAFGEAFSPARFLTEWNRLTKEGKQLLFGQGELRDALDDLATIASSARAAESFSNPSNTAGATAAFATYSAGPGAIVAFATGNALTGTVLLGGVAAQPIAARILTSPKLVRWLAQAANVRDRAKEGAWMRRLAAIGRTSPSLAGEVTWLRDYVEQARNGAVLPAPRQDDVSAPEAKGAGITENTRLAAEGRTQGLIEQGNIDLHARPRVENDDGSISTVRSISVNIDGREVLIPTVAEDGSGLLTDDEAIAQYERTGGHLGVFETPDDATQYAQQLHEDQAAEYR